MCTRSPRRCLMRRGSKGPRATPCTRWAASRSCSSAHRSPMPTIPRPVSATADVIMIWVESERTSWLCAGPGLAVLHHRPVRRPPVGSGARQRMGEIGRAELTELIQDAWLSRASKRRGERWLAETRPLVGGRHVGVVRAADEYRHAAPGCRRGSSSDAGCRSAPPCHRRCSVTSAPSSSSSTTVPSSTTSKSMVSVACIPGSDGIHVPQQSG